MPQLELRSLIQSAFSAIARLRVGIRSSLSWTALLNRAAAALISGSPQNNWSAGSFSEHTDFGSNSVSVSLIDRSESGRVFRAVLQRPIRPGSRQ